MRKLKELRLSMEDLTEKLMNSDSFGVHTQTVKELAEQWGVEESVVFEQLIKGIEVEREHTLDDALASEIARDHLKEDLHYYIKLAKMEAGE